jgi:predicted DNA-binding transcriptional regulator YafY
MTWLHNSRTPAVTLPEEGQTPPRPGWRQVSLVIESVEQGARQLLGFGAEVQVIDPPALRARLVGEARQLLAQYAS